MTRLHTSFVLGYHGCDRSLGEEILAGAATLKESSQDFDWLGPGVYFWEADPVRAREWAEEKSKRKTGFEPFVIGAAIDLRNCLDLMSRENLTLLAAAFESLREIHDKDKNLGDLPQNRLGDDMLLRKLDNAVIRHLHEIMADQKSTEVRPFDTVRGLFTEGDSVYPNSGFKAKTHVQLAVRERSIKQCIKGVFRVPDLG